MFWLSTLASGLKGMDPGLVTTLNLNMNCIDVLDIVYHSDSIIFMYKAVLWSLYSILVLFQNCMVVFALLCLCGTAT